MSQTPAKIAEYFGEVEPILAQVYSRQTGWVTLSAHGQVGTASSGESYAIARRQPITMDLLRNLRRHGVTAITASKPDTPDCGADFQLAEVIAYAERPLFGGNLI